MNCLKTFSLLLSFTLVACQNMPLKTEQNQVRTLKDAYSEIDYVAFKNKQTKKPVVALVLGSGGARGYAHIGVIEVLEQRGIKPDFIVGTSAGSIVGSIYASGKSAAQLKQIALDLQVNDVRDINIGLQGFFDGKKVENYVNTNVNNLPLEQLAIPMFVVATELKQGNKVVFNKGSTGQAVRASISIPSMFIPVNIDGVEYVDGGLVSPVPVNVARELGADIVIAVDILAQPIHTETSNVWGMFNQNINIMQNRLAAEELKNADIVIQPDLREKAHIFEVKGRQVTIQSGVTAAMEQIDKIQTLVKQIPQFDKVHFSVQHQAQD
ncbi:MAG: patatin-like phospholipase family protein [Candidatus Acinetobacter avistercoris]|uniref:patatin-like phospholipase family protein n=1 Tax=Acinetobacter sp. KS-LM10 TaxID=3120518 RepID=UPI001F9824AC|nr:patatin-like phospholipase family protein [Candidatus Acinetobacter avistercoris]